MSGNENKTPKGNEELDPGILGLMIGAVITCLFLYILYQIASRTP